jgi:hypothetical protein
LAISRAYGRGALNAFDGVTAMTDKTALYFSIGSLVVSIGSLAVSFVSVRIAAADKQQAKQAATLATGKRPSDRTAEQV